MQSNILRALSLDNLSGMRPIPPEFHLIISGGGFYGFYVIGIDKIMKKMKNHCIRYYSGSSVGAICAVLMCCNLKGDDIIALYERLHKKQNYFMLLRKELLRLLPSDAYLKCSGRVFVHATAVSWRGLRHVVFHQFSNNTDLVDACMASSNFPFLVSPHLFYRYKGRSYIDGCFTQTLPVFSFETTPQLLVKLYRVNYGLLSMFYPSDESVEGLVVKGAIESYKFFHQGIQVSTLEWYDRRRLKRKNRIRFFLLMIVPLVWLTRIITKPHRTTPLCDGCES
jgi:predicted acylesterase/phospholipase RssA